MADHSVATGPEPDDDEPTVHDSTVDEPTADEPTDGAEGADPGPGFMNRAARRAHAQGTKPQRSSGTSGQFGRRGTVQGPRQWGNRRSGG